MSSIFGQLNLNKQPVTTADLLPVEKVMNHWQADDTGLWAEHQVGLGHLMFYNTPESLTEKLPFYHSDSQLTITADARIDNRGELFSKLGISTVKKETVADSQLILAAYQKYGEDCVQHLIGDFAFAIWDQREQKLFCARDQMGVRPFFYYQDARIFAFASEIKGILAISNIDQSIDLQYFYNQLFTPPSQAVDTTIYQHIRKLKPAQSMRINASGERKLTTYWVPDAETELQFNRREDYYEGFLEHFTTAVNCRTRSQFNIGAQLSGGMDSSAITGVAARLMRADGRELITLSNTLPDGVTDPEITKLDERPYIDAVNTFNQIKNPIYLTKESFSDPLEGVDFALKINDGPQYWNPSWLMPLKNAASENNIRTILSGFPGDELVTYRGKYYFLDYLDQKQYFKYLLAEKKYPGFSKLQPLMPFGLRKAIHQLKTAFGQFGIDGKTALELFNIPKKYLVQRTAFVWDDPNFAEQFKSYRHFQKYRILQQHTSLRMESEVRYGLHFKTEPRFPMADIRLTQYYLSMPHYLKYEGTLARTAFRKALKDYLPPLILERDSKYGSLAPFFKLSDHRGQYTDILKASLAKLPKNYPLIKTDEVMKRLELAAERDKLPEGASRKERSKYKLPSLEVLRWLEKNHESIPF